MGQALYRKYRSKSLDEIVGQEHITTTLKNALRSGKISHAYLLTGPRGVGKTSVARILAYAVNDLPYDEKPHLDIIEIDAASNRRIDEVRDLRDKVHVLPTSAKYKVYIIDEVHMLTRESFNALLKTLEEPPAHVIFILATTEVNKLPDTIVSRTQHFAFKPIDEKKLVDHLGTIAKAEKLKIDTDALQLLAQHGGGSFRDSISMLDQVHSVAEHITRTEVISLLGLASEEHVAAVMESLRQQDPKQLLSTLDNIRQAGISATQLAKQLSEALRSQLINEGTGDIQLMRALLEVSTSTYPERLLELTLLEPIVAALPHTTATADAADASAVKTMEPSNKEKARKKQPDETKKVAQQVVEEEPPKAEKSTTKSSNNASDQFNVDDWPAVLAAVKKKYNTLYGILRMAEPSASPGKLVLNFRFAFHEKQFKDQSKRLIVTAIIQDLFGLNVDLECRLVPKQLSKTPTIKNNDAVDTVSNIFGGAELLES